MGIVIGIIVVLGLAAFFAVLTCKSKKSDLFKWIGIALFVAFCLTWVLPMGQFQSGTFYDQGLSRLGLSDIPTILYYAVYFCLTTLIYLFVVGGFYGVLSKTKSYRALVSRCAKTVKGKEIWTTIILIVFLVGLTSITKSALNMVVFLPFIISVLLNAKYDKVTATGVTFGSLLVGMLAATYGTDGLYWFNSYMGVEITTAIIYRVIIGGIALVLFTLYNVYRTIKVVKKNKESYAAEDTFAVEEVKGKTKIWPSIVILSIITVFVLLAFIGWNTNFKIGIFDSFHTWLSEFSFFQVDDADFTIFKFILGTGSVAFGMMEITALVTFLLIMTVIVALMERVSFNDLLNNFGEGFSKMVKPVALYALAYALFIIVYMCPFTAYLTDFAYGLTKSFNPYIATITSFITSIFHVDLGYTGYLVGSILSTTYAESLNVAHTIYITTYGLVQVFMPTSALLLVALAYMKIDYKDWFKYIWIFAAAMLVVLLIVVTIGTYLI